MKHQPQFQVFFFLLLGVAYRLPVAGDLVETVDRSLWLVDKILVSGLVVEKNRWSVDLGHGLGDIELGAPRSVVLQRLQEAEIEFDAEDDDPLHIDVLEMELQLTFSDGDPPLLAQIAVQDERVQFGSRPVLNCRLHEITAMLDVQEAETVWRNDEEADDSLPTKGQGPLTPASEVDLLAQGTLWIRPLGLGLRLWRGDITEIYLRLPEHAPNVGIGSLTAPQVQLSQRSDLSDHISRVRHPEARARRLFRFGAGAAFFACIATIVWQAAAYQRRWQEAPTVEAEVIATGPGGPETIATEFTVSYRDQNGVEHQANIGLADTYVPKTVGEKIELRYLPEKPDQTLSPSRARDAAFVKFFPYAIAAFAGYLVIQVAGVIILRLLKTPAGLSA